MLKNTTKLYGTSYVRTANNQDAVGKDKIISGIPFAIGCRVQFGIYNAPYWNGNSAIRAASNCYSYATNISKSLGQDYNFPHPGFCHTGYKPKNDEQLIDGVKKDGLILVEKNMKCPQGDEDNPVWLVALYSGILSSNSAVGDEWDYHFYRRVWSGNTSNKFYWAHKPGSDRVTYVSVDADYPDEDAKNRGYKKFIGLYLVPNITICGM